MQGININDWRNGVPENVANCGKCIHFHMDDPVHNMGHCDVNRMDRFAEEDPECGKFQIDGLPRRIKNEST